jgi:hypothetical protein
MLRTRLSAALAASPAWMSLNAIAPMAAPAAATPAATTAVPLATDFMALPIDPMPFDAPDDMLVIEFFNWLADDFAPFTPVWNPEVSSPSSAVSLAI